MFESLAGSLRGGVPDRLAQSLGSDVRDTRRAMEVSLPALIGGLRDKTREVGGTSDLLAMLGEDGSVAPEDIDTFVSGGDARTGAEMLDRVFGDRGGVALTSLSKASGLSTRLLARVMSMLAPVATGWLARKQSEDDLGESELADYLEGEAADLEDQGYGKVLALLGGAAATGAVAKAADRAVDTVPAPPKPTKPGTPEKPVVKIGENRAGKTGPDSSMTAAVDAPSAKLDDIEPPIAQATREPEVPNAPTRNRAAAVGGAVAGGAAAKAGTETIFPADAETEAPTPEESLEDRRGGGWLWWLVAGFAIIAFLGLLASQCGSDDPGDTTTTTDTAGTEEAAATAVPTTAPAVVTVDQGEINSALSIYPGVSGRAEGTVVVLEGVVDDASVSASAADAASRIPNVTGVDNRLVVDAGNPLSAVIEINPNNLSVMHALLAEAGLKDSLAQNGPFTVFAPVNSAFDSMQDLEELRADPARLSEFLQYHVVPGVFRKADLANTELVGTLLGGESINVSVAGDGEVLLNELVTIAPCCGDVEADNGVLHIVTSVLRPGTEGGITAPQELGEALELGTIGFEPDSATLTADSEVEVTKVVDYLLASPQPVEVAGHTDSDGPEDYNQELSQERADAVKQFLVNNGVPQDSITAIGYGESEPIVPNDTPENKKQNRRIEFNLGVE